MTFCGGNHVAQDYYHEVEHMIPHDDRNLGTITGMLEMIHRIHRIYNCFYQHNNFSVGNGNYHHGWRKLNFGTQGLLLSEFLEELDKLEQDYEDGWFVTYHRGGGVMRNSTVKPRSKLARPLEINNLQTMYLYLDTSTLTVKELKWHLLVRGAKRCGRKAVLKERLDSQIVEDNRFDLNEYMEYQMEIALGVECSFNRRSVLKLPY